jgi:hypothetical protein
VVDPRSQVAGPVGEQVGELVQAEGDRRDREDGAEQQERLPSGVGCGDRAGVRAGQVDGHGDLL